jgi:mortality factor 4-like protein 1
MLKRLLSLPRPVSAKNLVEEYLEHKEKKVEKDQLAILRDLFDGLLIWFDRALPLILLYKHEMEQYEALKRTLGEDVPPSAIYGGEHLIRIFVRIPGLVKDTSMSQGELNEVFTKLTDFVKFIEKERERYAVLEDYVLAADHLASLQVATKEELLAKLAPQEKMSPAGRAMRATAGKNKKYGDEDA